MEYRLIHHQILKPQLFKINAWEYGKLTFKSKNEGVKCSYIHSNNVKAIQAKREKEPFPSSICNFEPLSDLKIL